MSVSHVVKSLLKAQGMSLVLVTSGLLLTGCGAGSADTAVQTETTTPGNPDSGTGGDTGGTPDNGGNNGGGGSQPEPHSLSLTSQPSGATIYEGQSQTFSLAVSHNYPITIRWFKNGNQISGATGTSYTVSNATTGSAGTYSCSVTDGELTVNCNSFALTVNRMARITTQPTNQAVSEGVNVQLSVVASGTGPLSYQWYFNGQSLSGASAATLSLNNIAVDKSGSYYVVVSNAGSSATSNTVNVSVTPAIVTNGRAQISWSRPTTRADGSTLSANEIAGYKLYYSQSSNGSLSPLVDLTSSEVSVVVDELAVGTHYFAMSTRDTNGLESSLSARFSVTIQ
jgi:hypothetical protein